MRDEKTWQAWADRPGEDQAYRSGNAGPTCDGEKEILSLYRYAPSWMREKLRARLRADVIGDRAPLPWREAMLAGVMLSGPGCQRMTDSERDALIHRYPGGLDGLGEVLEEAYLAGLGRGSQAPPEEWPG